MHLLVSVSDAAEARHALEGGADVIDAKDPSRGALGAVTLDEIRRICEAIGGRRPVTAALGDATTEDEVSRLAVAFASAGVRFVKVGLPCLDDLARTEQLLAAAVQAVGPAPCGVVAVAYADAGHTDLSEARGLVSVAARAGALGVLLDTTNKNGPGLPRLVTTQALTSWVAAAHAAGLLVAIAGRLTAEDFEWAHGTGADIVGVRGAACDGGRTGRITAQNVRMLTSVQWQPQYR